MNIDMVMPLTTLSGGSMMHFITPSSNDKKSIDSCQFDIHKHTDLIIHDVSIVPDHIVITVRNNLLITRKSDIGVMWANGQVMLI
jgi:hypothetical protein